MKTNIRRISAKGLIVGLLAFFPLSTGLARAEGDFRDILRQGLLGAGTGALSAGISGGNAGKGALIGAGTNVIGGALLGMLTGSSSQGPASYASPVSYAPVSYIPQQTQPVYTQIQPVYPVETQPVYYTQPAPVYQPPDNGNLQIVRQGLLGAGVGAISASTSGGNAGQGALFGAGTNVIGGALLSMLTGGPSTSQSQPVYYSRPAPQPAYTSSGQPSKKIVRHYDTNGILVSEDEYWE